MRKKDSQRIKPVFCGALHTRNLLTKPRLKVVVRQTDYKRQNAGLEWPVSDTTKRESHWESHHNHWESHHDCWGNPTTITGNPTKVNPKRESHWETHKGSHRRGIPQSTQRISSQYHMIFFNLAAIRWFNVLASTIMSSLCLAIKQSFKNSILADGNKSARGNSIYQHPSVTSLFGLSNKELRRHQLLENKATSNDEDIADVTKKDSSLRNKGKKKIVLKKRHCKNEGCTNWVVQGGVCVAHDAMRKRCSIKGCTSKRKQGGLCIRHGGICKIRHGVVRKGCTHKGCINKVMKGGICYHS